MITDRQLPVSCMNVWKSSAVSKFVIYDMDGGCRWVIACVTFTSVMLMVLVMERQS